MWWLGESIHRDASSHNLVLDSADQLWCGILCYHPTPPPPSFVEQSSCCGVSHNLIPGWASPYPVDYDRHRWANHERRHYDDGCQNDQDDGPDLQDVFRTVGQIIHLLGFQRHTPVETSSVSFNFCCLSTDSGNLQPVNEERFNTRTSAII